MCLRTCSFNSVVFRQRHPCVPENIEYSAHRKENQFPWTLSSSSSVTQNESQNNNNTIMTAKTTSSSCQQPAKETETQSGKTETEKRTTLTKMTGLCLRHQTTEYNVNYNDIIPLKHNSLVHSTIFCIFDLFSSPFFLSLVHSLPLRLSLALRVHDV